MRSPLGSKIRYACAVVALSQLLLRAPLAAPVLPQLRGMDDVRDWFNANKGHVRLILLLSPT